MRTIRSLTLALSIHQLCQYIVTSFVITKTSYSIITASAARHLGESKTTLEIEAADSADTSLKSRSTFQQFEDEIRKRIASAQGSGTSSDAAVDCFPLVFRQHYLERIATSSIDNNEESHSLARKMQERGGYFILELGGDEAKTMNDLWSCAEHIFGLNENKSKALPFVSSFVCRYLLDMFTRS